MGLTAIVSSLSSVPIITLAYKIYIKKEKPNLLLVLTASWLSLAGFSIASAASTRNAPHTTWLLGKDPRDGRTAHWSWLVWWPYHLGLRIKLLLGRLILGRWEPLFDKVLPGWFLGGWPVSVSMLPPGRPSVLDVTCELPRAAVLPGGRYLCLPVWDTRAPSTAQIDAGVDWALREHTHHGCVYIHCAHGHGRSAVLMAAALIAGGWAAGCDQAVSLMKAARPLVRLSRHQRAALEKWLATRTHSNLASTPNISKGSSHSLSAADKTILHHAHRAAPDSDPVTLTVPGQGVGGEQGDGVWPQSVHITVSSARPSTGVVDAWAEGVQRGVQSGADV